MRARIHRGADEIGGSCVELEARGRRLVLDLGRPLWARRGAKVPLPGVSGFGAPDPALLGVVISHPHQDHWGLVPALPPEVPIYVGEAAHRILCEAAFFGAGDWSAAPSGYLRDRVRFEVGPFAVTPFLNDHSAFDAYSLLVEADGARLFYTGDLRAHGRKAALFERLLAAPPVDLDVLMLEGTHVASDPPDRPPGPSEHDVEAAMRAVFDAHDGPILVALSAQNIDRVVSVYRAAIASARTLVVDLYAASVAAVARDSIPQPGFSAYRVWVPQAQRLRVKNARAFERVERLGTVRVYPEELARIARRAVFLFRPSLASELERAIDLSGARFVWSQWPGYLRPPHDVELRPFLERHGLEPSIIHSSGHASVHDLTRMVAALSPRRLVPIHTFGAERFESLFAAYAPVARQPDGAWWEVAG